MSHADEVLRKLLDQIANEQNYDNYELKLEPISSGGANYTSQLYLATVTNKSKEDLHLFAKVAIIGEKIRAQSPMKIYDTERLVYTQLGKAYERLQDDHNIPQEHRIVMPKFYGCNPNAYEETIVLENLVKRGFSTYNRFVSVDWEYASKAVTEMAKLHALSIAYQVEHPEEYAAVAEAAKFSWSSDDDDTNKKMFWERVITSAIQVIKEENRGRLQKHFSKLDANGFKNYIKPLYQPVLMHGDYRPSNLVHKRHEDGRLEIMVVDYQTLQAGSPVVDLLYFMFNGSDANFRAQYYEKFLDHYYSQLCECMERLHLQPKQFYTRADFDTEWREKLPFGLNIAAFVLPIVTVEVENAPKVSDDGGLSSFTVERTSDLFSERFNGIVDDCIKWGVI